MTDALLKIAAEDGYPLEAMLSVPDTAPEKLVLYVNGSGPSTYNVKRQKPDGSTYNYHDYFAHEFTDRKIAYCRYSTSGVTDGDTPPFYSDIDDEKYKTYLPHNSVSDIECIVRHIRTLYPEIAVYLLGWSEGSIIAPRVAANGNVKIDGLLLCGYDNENLHDTFVWQASGNAALIIFRQLFDYDRKGYVSKSDFEEDRRNARQEMFGEQPFEQFDTDGDGKMTAADLAPAGINHMNEMFSAIERGDDEWLKNNHLVRLTSAWWKEHFSLEPNKTVLPKLELPIHIFSGEYDSMTPMFYSVDIEQSFKALGKTNLTVHYFNDHNHDLNFVKWPLKNELSDGLRCIFETVENLPLT